MSETPEQEHDRRRLLVAFLDAPFLLLMVLTVTSFLGGRWWVFELTTHFRLQYVLAIAGLGIIYAVLRDAGRSAIAVFLLIPHLFGIVPYYYPSAAEPSDGMLRQSGTGIKCLSINVNLTHSDRTRLRELVRQEQPDLLLLMEVKLDWARKMAEREDWFSDHRLVSRSDEYGMAFLSTAPLEESRVLRPAHSTVSVLYTRVGFERGAVHVTGLHTPSPMGPHLARDRNRVLSGVAERVGKQPNPRIVMGDFNTTSFSPYFQKFTERTGLKDSRLGRGIQPTWPAFFRVWPLQICLDHVLVSEGIGVVRRSTGPDIGSDHLPVRATLQLP